MACVIDILCNTMSGIGAGFLTGGGGLLFQAYDIASFCEIEVSYYLIEYKYWIEKVGIKPNVSPFFRNIKNGLTSFCMA